MQSHNTITLTGFKKAADPSVEVTIPRELGPVRLLHEIGRGGMGVVYLGRHRMLDRDVAVKFLLHAVAGPDDPGFAGFLEGTRAAARVEHPALTTIHHADVVDGIPYLVMQYIDGPTLSEVLKQTGPLRLSALFAVLDAVSEAIGELHDREIVHRDIKPANILLDREGRVFVTDFGLACSRPRAQRGQTSTGLAGTPTYMAPEMFDGAVSLRSDVYALGITSFELLTGKLPFGGTLDEVREKHIHQALPVDLLQEQDVAAELIEVIERATHKDAMYRYKTARHFGNAFKSGVATKEVLHGGASELQRVVARSLHKDSDATTPEAAEKSPTSTYFARLSEIAGEKRAARKPSDKGDAHPSESPLGKGELRGVGAEASPVPSGDQAAEVGSIPGPPSAQPARAATLVADVTCVRCGYNLRGLSADGRCPECGEPVASSLRPDRLLFANPKWLSTIARGQTLIFVTMIATPILFVVAMGVVGLLRSAGLEFVLVMRLVTLAEVAIVGGGIVTGVFMSTRREPPPAALTRTFVTSRISRACALFGIPAIFAASTMSSFRGASVQRTMLIPFGEFVAPIGLALCVIGGVSLLLYLRKLAERVPDAKLIRSSRQLAKLLGALVPLGLGFLGLNALLLSSFALSEAQLSFLFGVVIVGIPAILTAVTLFLYWCLMVAYRRTMKRAISVAVSYDSLFGEVPTEAVLQLPERYATDDVERETNRLGEQANALRPEDRRTERSNPRDILKLTSCPQCDYSLEGLPRRHRCPECGLEYDESMFTVYGWPTSNRPLNRPLVWRVLVGGGSALVLVTIAYPNIRRLLARGRWEGLPMVLMIFGILAIGVTKWVRRRRAAKSHGGLLQFTFSSEGAGVHTGVGWPEILPWKELRRLRFDRIEPDTWRLALDAGKWRTFWRGRYIVGVINCNQRSAVLLREEIRRRLHAARSDS